MNVTLHFLQLRVICICIKRSLIVGKNERAICKLFLNFSLFFLHLLNFFVVFVDLLVNFFDVLKVVEIIEGEVGQAT